MAILPRFITYLTHASQPHHSRQQSSQRYTPASTVDADQDVHRSRAELEGAFDQPYDASQELLTDADRPDRPNQEHDYVTRDHRETAYDTAISRHPLPRTHSRGSAHGLSRTPDPGAYDLYVASLNPSSSDAVQSLMILSQ